MASLDQPSSSESSESDGSVVSSDGSAPLSEGDEYTVARPTLGIRPYMFEPRPRTQDDDTEEESEPDPYADRTGKSDWCTCGHCVAQEESAISFCCRECPQLDAIRTEIPNLKCSTEHEGLRRVGTDVHVLRAAYNANRRKYGQRRGRNQDTQWAENTKHRHVAYGNIVALAWGWLGRRNRVPLPSCVMEMIRGAFPSEDGSYVGFHEACD